MNIPKYSALVFSLVLALGLPKESYAHGGGGSSHGSSGSHAFASGFHASSHVHHSTGNLGTPTFGLSGTPTFGATGTPTFGVTGHQADFPSRVASRNSANRLTRPTNGWDPHWDRVWHGHHYHWNNGAWGIVNDGDYPFNDSYYFPASSDVYPDMSYEYGDTAPAAVAPAVPPPADAVTTIDGAAPAPARVAAGSGSASKPGSIATAVQRNLAARGYYEGRIDGIVNESTRDAISHFQEDNDLPATGTITQSLLQGLGL